VRQGDTPATFQHHQAGPGPDRETQGHVLVTPMPRYTVAGCCSNTGHCSNRRYQDFEQQQYLDIVKKKSKRLPVLRWLPKHQGPGSLHGSAFPGTPGAPNSAGLQQDCGRHHKNQRQDAQPGAGFEKEERKFWRLWPVTP
jgi:hypothetical protein